LPFGDPRVLAPALQISPVFPGMVTFRRALIEAYPKVPEIQERIQ